MILRPDYINAVKPFIDIPIIKILAGVRRSGKSTIFEMLVQELKSRGIREENIIQRKYNTPEYEDSTSKDIYSELIQSVAGKGKCYLFLDEVQEIDGWEKIANTLSEDYDTDIYITGSNSKLMPSEISTYLTGRYVLIPVYTLSFREYISFRNADPSAARELFDEYVQYGGFPIIGKSSIDIKSAYQIVEGIYASVITRDISKRHKIRNKELFDRVVRYIIENVGKTFSASSISKFLKSENRSISVETVYNYLKWLEEAFIIYPCRRYDIQGKSVLKTQEKYYLSDISIKYSLQGFDPKMLSAVFENIIFLEMKRRGYDVFIGKNGTKEIDFIGIRREEKIYVQVCVRLPENSSRETDNLMEIKDHYHKYVVCRDPLATGNDNGIEITHIADFLLRDNW